MNVKKGIIFKIALLSSSLLLTGVNVVSAILPMLQEVHTGASKALVQQFITLPTIAQVAACLIGGMMAAKFGKKRMLILGTICFMAGGIAPLFVDGLGVKIALRLILGAGIGFIQPLSSSLIADFFDGPECDTMIGLQSASVGLGSIIMTFIVSCIMKADWTMSYLVYTIGFLILILTVVFVPDVQRAGDSGTARDSESTEDKAVRKSIPKGAAAMCVFQFVFTTALYCIFISLSYAVVDTGIGTAEDAALLLTVYSVFSLIGGIIYGKVFGVLKKNIGSLAVLMLGLAFVFIGVTRSLPIYFICMAMGGFGFAWFMPYTITCATEKATLDNSSFATSLVFTGNGLGGFFAAYFITAAGTMFGNTESVFSFVICGIVEILLAVVMWIYLRTSERNTNIMEKENVKYAK